MSVALELFPPVVRAESARACAPAPEALELRSYQRAAADAFIAACVGAARRHVVVLPTGTGKTMLGASIARRLCAESDTRCLWLAHTYELVSQPRRAFAAMWPDAGVGIVRADEDDWSARIVLGSVQTLRIPERLERLADGAPFGLVVVDEAHHAVAASYRAILDGLGALEAGGPPVLGLTATAERGDGLALGQVWQGVAYRLSLADAIRDGHLVPPRPVRVTLADLHLEALPVARSGEFLARELDAEMLRAGAAEAAAKAWLEHARGRTGIVFTISIDQARRVAEALRAAGVRAEHVSGYTPPLEREAILARLASGATECVANAAVLLEGFDAPSISAIVMARPTRSRTLYIQAIGRGLRLAPGKVDCLVIDLVGAQEHGLSCSVTLEGALRAEAAIGGGDILDPEEDARAEPFDPELERLRSFLAAAAGGGTLRCSRGRYRWIEAREGLLALEARGPDGYATVLLARDDEGLWRGGALTPKGPMLPLRSPEPLEELRVRVEAWMERWLYRPCGAGGSWRRGPPSERQIKALAAWKIRDVPDGATAGDVGDLLTARIARQKAHLLFR